MSTLTDHAVQFILNTEWVTLPAEIQHQSKRCLLDTLGALLAGMETPVGELMSRVSTIQYRGDEATVLVSGKRTSAAGAALANGFAGNALDIDDGYRLVKGHPGACVLPVTLAAGELAARCSGKDFLSALVVGYEIGIRAGVIRHATYDMYHSSGSWGAIAGAAAAGKLLGFDADTLLHAMGAAEYHAPIAPMMKCIDVPSMGKDSIGWGTMVGMLSALMAEDGFTGIHPLFADAPDAGWVESLGRRFEIMNLYFKPYCACRWGQPAVAGALHIAREYQLKPDNIETIIVDTFEAAARLSCTPPKDTEEAQYNLAFPVAAALLDGEVGPRQVLPPRLNDPAVHALMGKVKTCVDDRFEKIFPAKAGAEVTVTTTDGREFKSGQMEAIWEPPDTLPSDKELEAKFKWLVEPVLGKKQTDRLVAMIWTFEEQDDLCALIDYCIKREVAA